MTEAPFTASSRIRQVSQQDFETLRQRVQARLAEKQAEDEQERQKNAHPSDIVYDDDDFEILRLLDRG